MPTTCCVCKVAATSVTKKDNITFHRFPLKDEKLYQNWLQNINKHCKELTLTSPNLRICCRHFARTCFTKSSRGFKLAYGSVPTIFKKPTIKCVYCGLFTTPVTDRTFHRFPVNNAAVLEKWKAAIGKNVASTVDVTVDTLLCSIHFEKSLFYMHGKDKKYVRMRDHAVPTIFSREQIQETVTTSADTYAGDVQCHIIKDEPLCVNESMDEPHATMDASDETGILHNNVNLAASEGEENAVRSRRISDHNYVNSPQILHKKCEVLKRKYKTLYTKFRLQNRQIVRLKKRNTVMKGIIAQLLESSP